MGFDAVFATVFPVLALVGMGFVLGPRLGLDLRSLTELVVYLGGPALIFVSLLRADLAAGDIVTLAGGTAAIALGVGVLLRLAALFTVRDLGRLYPPAMFFNSGNMLLPLCLLAFGEEGLARGVVVFAAMTFLQSTLGVALASGRGDFGEMLRLPYFYAVVAAFLLRAGGGSIPGALLRPLEMVGDLAVPLMLIALGLRLRTIRVDHWGTALWITLARIGGGYAVAWVFVVLVGAEGVTRDVLLLASVMPAAVINFVFAEKYAGESSDVATVVVASTLVSFFTTPLVLAFGL